MNLHRIFTHILETPEVEFWVSTYREYFFDVGDNIRFRVENYDPTDFELGIRETDNGNAYLIVKNCDEDALIAAVIQAQMGKNVGEIFETFIEKGFKTKGLE